MIRIFYGENREAARKMIDSILSADYEVLEAENLSVADMASTFLGVSLFGETRSILIKDLSSNKECWEQLPKYTAECPHNVVLWEMKLDKRSAAYKELSKDKNVEFKEFAPAKDPDQYLAFDTINAALAGKDREVMAMLGRLETTGDPYMFMGLVVSQMTKKLPMGSARTAKILKLLAKADMDMKTAGIEPWTIVRVAMLKISKC